MNTTGRDRQFDHAVARAVVLLARARRVVVTTGAGMSKESGIPTFRDAQTGLWAKYDPETLATREGFRRNPSLVWNWYAGRRAIIEQARPHEGHVALARIEPRFESFHLFTQNIDGLHVAAGSKNVIELHGSILRTKCFDAGHPSREPLREAKTPPRCSCGSFLRPDVVWFGEMLNPDHLDLAADTIEACDVLLVVGTSGLVYPAAGFAEAAVRAGVPVIEINPEPTPLSRLADVMILSGARTALMEMEQRLSPGA
ncbi:MAG TPA: NAD-dependent deacylase [Candidatus Krumholzibacteria bacterium]|nr:NAD-dependent deacylase [Candidatus Krumholzibacteria bacterium]